jgi:23S rRNA (pseudouridine1915-N3)-methyltransferase
MNQSIIILTVGKLKSAHWQKAAEEYIKRLSPFTKLTIMELPAKSFTDSNKQAMLEAENSAILNFIKKRPEYFIVVCDEHGENLTSVKLAQFWQKSTRPSIFVIGGTQGLSAEVKKTANLCLALSSLTLPHELARVILLEQLYCSATIIAGKSYHY